MAMSNFIRCNNTGKQWKELIICEGKSASSGIRNASDTNTQAIFLLRGVVLNAFKTNTVAEVLENEEWKNLVTILKAGIGPSFDINKLYYNRINIFTDADVDGFYISSGILAFIYKYMRPIIENGKLYKIYSPLYSLKDSEYKFAMNKSDLIDIYHKKIVKNYKIKTIHDDSYMSKDDLYDFLTDTYDYADTLIRVSKENGKVNKFLIEAILAYLVMNNIVNENNYQTIDLDELVKNQKFIKSIMSFIQNIFKEIVIDESGEFVGVINGIYCNIKLTHRFFRKTILLFDVYRKYGYKIHVLEKNGKESDMTIGEFLDDCKKLVPAIDTRFKGLGEINADQLYKTALDINNRVSVQYTIEDVERELGIFNLTHGNAKENVSDRKELMKKYKIKREDLDN